MDVAVLTRLKHQLEGFTLNLRNAPHVMRDLKESTVVLCQLDSEQIKSLPEDNDLIGLRETLLGHVNAYLNEIDGT